MSTSTGAFVLAANGSKKSSGKANPRYFLGSVAIAGVVLGCAWTVYSNVFGASVYPSVDSAAFEAPAVQRPAGAAPRSPASIVSSVFASLPEPAPAILRPESVPTSIMFNERFAASAPQGIAPRPVDVPRVAEVAPPVEATRNVSASKQTPKFSIASKPKETSAASSQVALNAPTPAPQPDSKPASLSPAASIQDLAQRAKAAVMSIASGEKQGIVDKLWGKQPSHGSLLSYASADASVTGSLPDTKAPSPTLGGSPPYDRQTAVYDISARTVYLPDGTKLEAHSGLGSKLDDIRYSHVRMQGVTPPHIYELTPRESLFHGVPALRLTPIGGEDKIFGRSGLLAHTYMLGPNGDSNGCVSFRDYNAFLDAYRNQGIKRLAVVAKVE